MPSSGSKGCVRMQFFVTIVSRVSLYFGPTGLPEVVTQRSEAWPGARIRFPVLIVWCNMIWTSRFVSPGLHSRSKNLEVLSLNLQRPSYNALCKEHGHRSLNISLNICHMNDWMNKWAPVRPLKPFSGKLLKEQSKAKFSNQETGDFDLLFLEQVEKS